MTDGNIARAGQHQARAYLNGEPLDVMLQDFAPTNEDEAYLVQRDFIDRLAETRGRVGGHKIAYTSAVMRESRGISEPCFGLIFAGTIADSPAELTAADYTNLAIECEVAVRLASDVPADAAPYTRKSIAAHVESLMAAFEVVDRRPSAAPDGADPAISAIVTNISNGGAVLGPAVRDWQSVHLASSRGTVSINGEQRGEGLGSDVMGHPLEALVWLANDLAGRGEHLRAGEIVITGSIVPPIPLDVGDVAVVSVDGLGEARISVR